jgi:bacterioferritin-associated ferredoxin
VNHHRQVADELLSLKLELKEAKAESKHWHELWEQGIKQNSEWQVSNNTLKATNAALIASIDEIADCAAAGTDCFELAEMARQALNKKRARHTDDLLRAAGWNVINDDQLEAENDQLKTANTGLVADLLAMTNRRKELRSYHDKASKANYELKATNAALVAIKDTAARLNKVLTGDTIVGQMQWIVLCADFDEALKRAS